jgi:hypothetical protein
MLTVTIVLTGENWNDVMHHTASTFSPWASLFFLQIIIIGNFMLLNIFLAILLQYTDGLGDDVIDYATYKAEMRKKYNKGKMFDKDAQKIK